MRRLALFVAAWLGGAAAQAVTAADFSQGFALPSGRLQCQYDEDPAGLTCELRAPSFQAPPRPADCPLAWGDSLYLASSGRPGFSCHGDTVFMSRPVLAYGKSWRQGGFACTSNRAGVRCTNTSGHGFTLARARYSLF